MTDRRMIIVDCETTGLDPLIHVPVEVAWCDATGDAGGWFLPPVFQRDLDMAEPKALEINGYHQRIARSGLLTDDGTHARVLHAALAENTLAGSNPAFDAAMLDGLFRRYGLDPQPWHHRMWDLSAYAAGVLGLDELPGLAKVCDLLVIEPPDHTAVGDCTATRRCFTALRRICAMRQSVPS